MRQTAGAVKTNEHQQVRQICTVSMVGTSIRLIICHHPLASWETTSVQLGPSDGAAVDFSFRCQGTENSSWGHPPPLT